MSKMNLKDFKKNEFYQVPKWILEVKSLQPVDILVYMLAMNNWKLSEKNEKVDEDGSVYFYLTHETLKDTLDIGKNQVIYALKRLVDSGVLIQEKEKGKPTKFYLENDIEKINFNPSSLKKGTTQINTTSSLNSGVEVVLIQGKNQSEFSDISNNINKIINNNNLKKENFNLNNSSIKQELNMVLKTKGLEFRLNDLDKLIQVSEGDIELIKKQVKNFGDRGIGYVIAAVRDRYQEPKKLEIKSTLETVQRNRVV